MRYAESIWIYPEVFYLCEEKNMDITVEKLEKKFIGSGEVHGVLFEQVKEGKNAYIYKCNGGSYYEVFLKKKSQIAVDFQKHIYSETEFKERYPKARHFGFWAWSYPDIQKALNHFESLEYLSEEEVEKMVLHSGC